MITLEILTELERLGVKRLSLILEKPYTQVTEYENAVLRLVHWFANYQFQFESENRLLSLIISLETLFVPRDGNPIGTAIAEAVAIVCSDQLAERKQIKARIKDLYKLRSAISHGGHKAVMDIDIRELFGLVRKVIFWSIERLETFKSLKDLSKWIEDQKLGNPSVSPRQDTSSG